MKTVAAQRFPRASALKEWLRLRAFQRCCSISRHRLLALAVILALHLPSYPAKVYPAKVHPAEVNPSQAQGHSGGSLHRRNFAATAAELRSQSPPVAQGEIQFEDITRKAGIDFHLACGTAQKLYIMDAMCGGIAFIDYDADGWPDIFLLNGSTLEMMRSGQSPAGKLYHNNRNGTFSDVTAQMGLTAGGWGMGVAVGDYDNDGFDDLYITYLDHAVLYHNDGGKKFTDVTARAGVGNAGRWGTSAAFGDYDNDGNLDLYVANYVDLDLNNLPQFGSSLFCQYRGFPVSCGPRGLKGSRDRLYHNRGDGTFEDVSEKLNIDPQSHYGLGVLWLDYNNDGCQDIYVADDSSPSMLYRGDCKGGFTEVAATAGVAYGPDGQEQAGMGVDAADYDHDGFLDLVKTNFSDDANNLYHNDHDGGFTDLAGPSGFGPPSIPYLGFGAKFFDADNDGWSDIFIANGHVNPQVDEHSFGVAYAERNFLFHNLRNGKFEEIALKAGPALKPLRVGRGAAIADIDNDGRLDLLVSNLDGAPLLLRNVTTGKPASRLITSRLIANHGIANHAIANHWITIKTVGTKSNRDGIGARIEIEAGQLKQIDEVRANSSYLSASDLRVHFGLGQATRIDRITVRWPSGQVDVLKGQGVDRQLVVREGGSDAHSGR